MARITANEQKFSPIQARSWFLLCVSAPLRFKSGCRGKSFVSDFGFWTFLRIWGFGLLISLSGCIFWKTDPTAKLATAVDPGQGFPDYWWNQPANEHASSADFEKLWSTCKGEMYLRLFPLDREQYREGLLSSEPVVSKQFFEPWRQDAVTVGAIAESSLADIRRTVRIEVTRKPDGTFQASPKVLIERFAITEHRLTSITQYHAAIGSGPVYDPADQSGAVISAVYWYPVRRDTDLEKVMAASIRHQLGQ